MSTSRLDTLKNHALHNRSHRRTATKYLLTVGIGLLAYSSFVDFGKFISEDMNKRNPYAYEIAAAILGTALTIALTTFLLRHQTNSEIDRERNVKIYETKLAIYQSFLKRIEDILADGKLDEQEFFQLQLAFQEVVFIAGKRVLNELPAFAHVLASAERGELLREDAKQRILHAFGRLAAEVRGDLHDPQPHGEDLSFDVEDVLTMIEANFALSKPKRTLSGTFDRRNIKALDSEAKEKKVSDNEAKRESERLFGQGKSQEKVRCEAFFARCTPEDRALYSDAFYKVKGARAIEFDSIGVVFRSENGRLVLYIHPDTDVPNKIFSDNLSLQQKDAAGETLHKVWAGRGNLVSHWSFTTQAASDGEQHDMSGEIVDLINALEVSRPKPNASASK